MSASATSRNRWRILLALIAAGGLGVAGLGWRSHTEHLRLLAEQEKAKTQADPEQEADRARVEEHMRTIGYVQ